MNSIDLKQVTILKGRLANLESSRETSDFLFSNVDRQAIGITAVAAALAGSGGAVGLASMADVKEEATRVSFDLGDKKVSGWLMWSPFVDGDEVQVVAEKSNDGSYVAFAVLRPADRTIALYPHCSRGRIAHARNSFFLFLKTYAAVFVTFLLLMLLIEVFEGDFNWRDFALMIGVGAIGAVAIYGWISYRISKRFMPFVYMAEAVFESLGWKDAKRVDLPARSRAERKSSDTPGLGKLYFRY
ncbi:putative type VI secretion system effector [Xanthomonas oryzae]|uniref:putative type VI secretion system effector n=1 Tax=Xanthomonas oryzae TaxID=347 RepID=UPI001A9277EB|nr:putative type VI secretion system effector [Xanthomonas oryzae]